MRLSRFLITLPLIAAPVLALVPRAGLAAMEPIEALQQLAKSKAADVKCNVLGNAERDELSFYLARAEVAVTRTMPVSDVQGSLASGRITGANAACDTDGRREIAATLAAARRAMAAAETPRAAKRPPRMASKSILAGTQSLAFAAPRDDLGRYGRQAMAYYLERRCTHLSGFKTRDFYNRIIARHQAAVRAYGRPAVTAELRRAESEAAQIRCGEGRSTVAAGYSDIRR